MRAYLEKAIPVLLIAFALYFIFAENQRCGSTAVRVTVNVCAGCRFYGGVLRRFFGPGAGTFFTMGYVALLGYGLPKATGNTKLLNFTSNITSLLFFALSGHIVWLAGLVMG